MQAFIMGASIMLNIVQFINIIILLGAFGKLKKRMEEQQDGKVSGESCEDET